jgi:hypothetical protein
MLSLEYFLAAESYSVDRDKGLVSIFNVLSDLTFEKFPAEVPKLVCIIALICSPEEIEGESEHQIVLRFKVPGVQQPEPFRGSFPAQAKHHHLFFEVQNFFVEEPGEVVIELQIDDECKAHHTITFLGQTG